MRVLTEPEAKTFSEAHGFTHAFSPLDPDASRSLVTADVGRRCQIAKLFTALCITEHDATVCLDITDWAVWPSSQNPNLFYSYRRSLGENRLLIDAHFHVFTANEVLEFRNILHLALISLFDVAGASTSTDFRFYASHDEWVEAAWYENASWLPQLERQFGK